MPGVYKMLMVRMITESDELANERVTGRIEKCGCWCGEVETGIRNTVLSYRLSQASWLIAST